MGADRAAAAEGASGGFAIRVASGCRTGRRCRGSCSCCTPGSRGGICRRSSASARGRPASGGWMSGSGPACGSGCTSCCWRELRAAGELEWSRAVADSSHVQAKKGAPRRARARLIRGQKRLQAPPPRRRDRDPARLDAHRRQPQRRHPADPAARPRARRCAARSAGRADGPTAADRRPRLRPRQVPPPSSGSAGSSPRSPAARPSTAPASAATAGSSSAPSPGCTSSNGCSSATTAAHDIHEAFLALGCCLVCFRRLQNSL